jgi:hypothetical protein
LKFEVIWKLQLSPLHIRCSIVTDIATWVDFQKHANGMFGMKKIIDVVHVDHDQ